MKGPSRRPEQVAEAVRQVVADALLREVRDPRVGMVTISGVDVTRDLGWATVRVAAHGEPAEQAAALEGLRSAAGFLRSRVAKALASRTVPELKFVLDQGLAHAARIDALLAEVRREGA